ncbi:hypothetical protein ABIA33_006950 [Streptacidiphilus sp. MAP12-16]|uniref:hypothetical protein n=1 Tax=Streptacidiphilus sp. MAP12-16 TaxID=3156300 RepID=UPI0035129D27
MVVLCHDLLFDADGPYVAVQTQVEEDRLGLYSLQEVIEDERDRLVALPEWLQADSKS